MGNRLTKIYTRTGDKGTTGLGGNLRVSKDDVRIEALGTIDELNSLIGQVISFDLGDHLNSLLLAIQHDLFDMGGDLYIPGRSTINDAYVSRLENELDQQNQHLGPLKEFILPGGTPAAASCHHARTVCRRAERLLVKLSADHEINANAISYINRLSDLLFVVARTINKEAKREDIFWNREN